MEIKIYAIKITKFSRLFKNIMIFDDFIKYCNEAYKNNPETATINNIKNAILGE